MTHSRTIKTKGQIVLTIFVVVVFAILFALVVISLKQKSSNTTTTIPKQTEEVYTVKKVIEQDSAVKTETLRQGYELDERPFDSRSYQYDERTPDFRFVCSYPCSIDQTVLDQEFAAIAHALSTMRGVTGVDIDSSLMPFEVHATEDDRCQYLDYAAAYMTRFVDDNNYRRGILCFFHEKYNYDRTKFPYSTSVHEVMHLFQENRVPHIQSRGGSILWEGMAEMMESFFLKSSDTDSFCHHKSLWWLEQFFEDRGEAHVAGRNLFFNLCNQYGLDYQNLPVLFKTLISRGGVRTEKEFVDIISSIVGTDTSSTFREAGINVQ